MPFAFGVAPLLQVIGPNIPMVPTSRAVQIPLFKLVAGKGDQPIIDHINYKSWKKYDNKFCTILSVFPLIFSALLIVSAFIQW